jgi:hypothetical protein
MSGNRNVRMSIQVKRANTGASANVANRVSNLTSPKKSKNNHDGLKLLHSLLRVSLRLSENPF